ncbi:ScbA/BarX family gamma-butyrolactone biosynthesis protein [Kitasatospora sp. NPDC056651]|uniref:ScbA/BarX family gamma-butyrolactone biosynthesis protein n=1 Tax=Kitasatospora sp. NPDC056651 TaxID=3345892 RepID=UPI00368758B9
MSDIETLSELTPHHPVSRNLVHKSDASEVLLTAWRRTGPDSFSVTAHWPADRPFYRSADGGFESVLPTETVRQLFPLICHVGYDTPFDHHLVWEHFRCDLDPAVLRPAGGPVAVELRVTCSDLARRRAGLAGMTMDVDILRDGIPLATARSRFTVQSPAVYLRLRGPNSDRAVAMAAAPPAPEGIPAARAGRLAQADVVLSETPPGDIPERIANEMSESPETGAAGWWLRVDTAHPTFFDHPVDHVPGMLLLEAARQAAQAVRHPVPAPAATLSAVFHRYVDLDAPCRVTAGAESPALVRVTAEQHGRVCFTADVGTA